MIKPILSSILVASVLFATTGQAMASDRNQSYRDRGTEHHQSDRDGRRQDYRHEFDRRERHPEFAYRYRELRPAWRHGYPERYPARYQYRYWNHPHPRPVVVVRENDLMAPIVAGAILGAIIANNQAR